MRPMAPLPVDAWLVPQPDLGVPAGFTSARQALTQGLPFTWTLVGDLALALVAPTGFATLWRDADPTAIASASHDEVGPHSAPRGADPREQVALRLIVRRARSTLGTVPLAAGLWRISPDGDGSAAAIELFIAGWVVNAGCIRGPGDFGSYIEIGWKPGNVAVDAFDPAAMSPRRKGGYLP